MQEHIDILLIIGIAIFMGLSGGKFFQRLKIPQVVGYIIIGVILGDSVMGLFEHNIIDILTPINSFALGLIGFMIGGELKKDIFKKYGKKFIVILLWEGILTFVVVTAAVYLVTNKFALAILLGALASATAPAATVDVLWEYKAKGILTTTILAIVALDDGLALILYGFASAFAKTLVTGDGFSITSAVLVPIKEISLALALGSSIGFLLYKIMLKTPDKEQLLAISVGSILLNVGLSSIFDLDLILSSMTMGIVIANISPNVSKTTFSVVKGFTPPIYVLFFVLVGARLQMGMLPKMGLLGAVYVFMRALGKISGSYLGALTVKAEDVIRKYLGITLFSQAGVAIGLAIAIYQSFSKVGPAGQEIGMTVINVIAATTFLVQLIGPPCVKWGIVKAGETGKDITEEDILNKYTVSHVMGKDVDVINSNDKLSDVVRFFKKARHSIFPVIDKNKVLLGSISFDTVKDMVLGKGMEDLVVAGDLVSEITSTTFPDEPLNLAMNKFILEPKKYIPVVDKKDPLKFVGILHKKDVKGLLTKDTIGKLVGSEPSSIYTSNISKLITSKNIKLELDAKDKEGVIREIVNFIAKYGDIKNPESVTKEIIEREFQTTTGIGQGIAIPHIRTKNVSDVILAFCRSSAGINFFAIDKQPVYFIFMIVTPVQMGQFMVRIMGRLSRMLSDEVLRDALMAAQTKDDVIKLIKEKECQ